MTDSDATCVAGRRDDRLIGQGVAEACHGLEPSPEQQAGGILCSEATEEPAAGAASGGPLLWAPDDRVRGNVRQA